MVGWKDKHHGVTDTSREMWGLGGSSMADTVALSNGPHVVTEAILFGKVRE